MAKYSTYIELDPRYESVVDLTSEERNPNLWQDYIVHDDMAEAMKKICESFKNEDQDKRRSFWIHGVYGTGKSYSALVLKHLFEDPIEKIRPFLERPRISPYKGKFTGIREKGNFVVVWRSGTTEIVNSTQLLMAVEMSVRQQLDKAFGKDAYYGKESIRQAVLDKLNDHEINWDAILANPAYGLCDAANSMDDVRENIQLETETGSFATLSQIAGICRDKGWALTSTVEQFEEWIKDIIAGNNLQKGGIVFIWDEFTTYLNNTNDDNVLQRLSELCKSTSFFMFLIVHRDPAWLGNFGEKTYEKIMGRYHELHFQISQDAAYDLIYGAIKVKDGVFKAQWEDIRNRKMKEITVSDFATLDSASKPLEQIRNVFPIHPMTVKLLTTVVDHFAASERTLFKFMKDIDGNVGFPHFIENNEEDSWTWLTPDFLWDYFFMRNSDLRETGTEAAKAYRHYKSKVDDDKILSEDDGAALNIFKAAMLLIAIMSTSTISGLRSHRVDRRIAATRNTLYKCFQGQLSTEQIDNYLNAFKDQNLLRLDEMPARKDARLELPYTSTSGDLFDGKLENIKRNNSRYVLFTKGAAFSKEVEKKLWDENAATCNRVFFACAASDTKSIDLRLKDINAELSKCPYKIGLLAVAVSQKEEVQKISDKLKNIAFEDNTGRLFVCLLHDPLTAIKLDEWYNAKTHAELLRESGNKNSADQKDIEAGIVVNTWAQAATGGEITAYYKDQYFAGVRGRDQLRRKVEEELLWKVFRYAPERIVTVNTAFKPVQEKTALSAIVPDKVNTNTQVNNIVNAIKAIGIFEAGSLQEIENATGTPQALVMANLAKTIREMLSDAAAKTSLDDIWQKLQSPPFGLYNTMTSAYLLGFIFKHYVNGEFHWVDGVNPNILTAENMGKMIYMLCRGETLNHYLSSGSESWKQFRSYVQTLFGLSDEEAANEEKARQHVREKMIKIGVPFWSLKYADEEKFGGAEYKNAAIQIVDVIGSFVIERDNVSQEDIMASVVTLFKGKGRLKNFLRDMYTDKSVCYETFLRFVYLKNESLQEAAKAIKLKRSELFDEIYKAMQSAVWSWEEEDVASKLSAIQQDFQMVKILRDATGIEGKTVAAIGARLAENFGNMKVPGKVLESMGYAWIPALSIMYEIAGGRTSNLTGQQKDEFIVSLSKHAKDAWSQICAERESIKDYVRQKGYSYTDVEISAIFSKLTPYPYEYNEKIFANEIGVFIDDIEDARKKAEIKELWQMKGGHDTVDLWCNTHIVPVLWLIPDEDNAHDAIRIIRAVSRKEVLSSVEVERALSFLKNTALTELTNDTAIQGAFFTTVGEQYRKIFIKKRDRILARIRFEVSTSVYDWAMRVSDIQKIISEVQREEGKSIDSLRATLSKLDNKVLQDKVILLLAEHPELYEYFVEDSSYDA
ncbi:MAG: hypothetical protein ABFD79_15420 [Phycisphaerales bacterium]